MRTVRQLLFFVMLLGLAACDNETNQSPGEETAVQFKSENIALPETRTSLTGDGWIADDRIGIYMMATGDGITGAKAANIAYRAGSSGATTNFTPVNTPETIYYPQTGTTDYIAYYPWKATGTGADNINNHLYPVNTAIQTDPAAIDLLYSNNVTGKARSRTEPVALTFDHALSKITFLIRKGDGMAGIDFTGMMVSIEGLNTAAKFNLGTGVMGTSETPAAITPRTVIAGETYDAIVIPQTSPAAAKVTFTINGAAYVWNMGSRVFAPAEELSVTITVNETSVSATGEIVPWSTGTAVTANAQPQLRTITYMPNGGTGGVSATTAAEGIWVRLPGGTGMTPPAANKIFGGWSTTADYSGDYYAQGASMTVSGNLTLYAIWSGDGTAGSPILIFDGEGLKNISYGLDKEYALCRDVVVAGLWGSIISGDFTGKFDGKGHTVESHDYQSGLFEKIEPNGVVRNVRVNMNLYENGSGAILIGGIASEANGALIENCYVDVRFLPRSNDNADGEITLGGIVGIANANTMIQNCITTGEINLKGSDTSPTKAGGIAGECDAAATIQNCVVLYGSITVSGGDVTVGRIAALSGVGTTFRNNYGSDLIVTWTSDLFGKDGDNCLAYPNKGWWTNTALWETINGSAWDFTNIWQMEDDYDYPKLRIQPL